VTSPSAPSDDGEAAPKEGLSRREIIAGAVALGVGAGIGAGAEAALGGGGTAASPEVVIRGPLAGDAIPFHGEHQAGIATPAQEYLHFASFDLLSGSRAQLRSLLKAWSEAAAQLAAGHRYAPAGASTSPQAAPVDGGEAVGLDPAELTVTFGLGPRIFQETSFGLSGQAPAELGPLPQFDGDQLDPARSNGDLCVQACANDPQVAFHAVHVLARVAAGTARLRWTQPGFGRTSATSRSQPSLRNLMGFKDGTDNIRAEDGALMDRFVWVADGEGPDWMTGGTYLIARRIRILFAGWDATSLADQERIVGRRKSSGAPLGGKGEFDPVDLEARSSDGRLTIPEDAHIRIASPHTNAGQRILRRGYSFAEATEAADGRSGEALDAGLFFICFQRSPQRQFVPLQSHLAGFDALARHTVHTASAIFACPPGAARGGYVGQELLG
jgi:deferrochelatase/peroxidase EfeB